MNEHLDEAWRQALPQLRRLVAGMGCAAQYAGAHTVLTVRAATVMAAGPSKTVRRPLGQAQTIR